MTMLERLRGQRRAGLGSTVWLLLTTAAGVAAGLLLTLWAVTGAGPGAIHAGPWVAWPRAGAPDADPYTRAILARRGDLPLGLGEGVAFFAREDSAGHPLAGLCTYRVAGPMPSARAWSLSVHGPGGDLLPNPSGRHALTSAEAVRGEPGRIAITLSAFPAAGNWLPVVTTEPFVMALRLYDTPLAAGIAGITAADLPAIIADGCR